MATLPIALFFSEMILNKLSSFAVFMLLANDKAKNPKTSIWESNFSRITPPVIKLREKYIKKQKTFAEFNFEHKYTGKTQYYTDRTSPAMEKRYSESMVEIPE